jgi:hypothetical protein
MDLAEANPLLFSGPHDDFVLSSKNYYFSDRL